jgi:hypothetical protein
MTEIAFGIASIACICGSGVILAKSCSLRNQENKDVAPDEYLLIRKDYYDDLKRNVSINKQPVLPPYTAIPLGNSACSRGHDAIYDAIPPAGNSACSRGYE